LSKLCEKRQLQKIQTNPETNLSKYYILRKKPMQALKVKIRGDAAFGSFIKDQEKHILELSVPDEIKTLYNYVDKPTVEIIAYLIQKYNLQVDESILDEVYFIDIETVSPKNSFPNPHENEIYSISIKKMGVNKIVVLLYIKDHKESNFEKLKEEDGCEIYFKVFNSEKNLLKYFFDKIKKANIVLGWNSYNFDYPYLFIRASIHNINVIDSKYLPDWNLTRKMSSRNLPLYFANRTPIESIYLDYMHLYKNYVSYKELESFSLNNIAIKEIGKGKKEFDVKVYRQVPTKVDEDLIVYNAIDAKLIEDIENKNKVLNTVIEIANLSNLTIELSLNASGIIVSNLIKKLGINYVDYVRKINHANYFFKSI